jgi:hypothetical protein
MAEEVTRRPSTLEEIRAQAKPRIIEIPGFAPGTTLAVAVRPVDLTAHLLTVGIGNPLLAAVRAARTEQAASEDVASEIDLQKLLPVLDAVARDALVEPTYEEILSVAPLTLEQKLTVFNASLGGTDSLSRFRRE